jgi:hypothetical protein
MEFAMRCEKYSRPSIKIKFTINKSGLLMKDGRGKAKNKLDNNNNQIITKIIQTK